MYACPKWEKLWSLGARMWQIIYLKTVEIVGPVDGTKQFLQLLEVAGKKKLKMLFSRACSDFLGSANISC